MIGPYREFSGFAAIVVIAIVGTLMITIGSWIIVASERSAKQMERELTFEERWEPVRELAPMLEMPNDLRPYRVTRQVEGMIPGAAPILPTHFTPARYIVVEEEMAEAAQTTEPAPPVKTANVRKASLRHGERDICARHGMVKEITRGGKSWRCRR